MVGWLLNCTPISYCLEIDCLVKKVICSIYLSAGGWSRVAVGRRVAVCVAADCRGWAGWCSATGGGLGVGGARGECRVGEGRWGQTNWATLHAPARFCGMGEWEAPLISQPVFGG